MVATNRVGYRLRDRTVVVTAVFAFILTVSLPMLIVESRAPAVNALVV